MPSPLESIQILLHSVQAAAASSIWGSIPPQLLPPAIFIMRAVDQTFSTLRMLSVTRGERVHSWLLGALQAFFFVSAVAGVLGQLFNPLNLIAYAAGYGAGSALGITIESWLAPGHTILRVVSPGRGSAMVENLRRAGWGVTEIPGHGLHGTVSVLLCTVPRRQLNAAQNRSLSTDPEAFITVERVRVLRGGWNP